MERKGMVEKGGFLVVKSCLKEEKCDEFIGFSN
jgi:hypothetical protein